MLEPAWKSTYVGWLPCYSVMSRTETTVRCSSTQVGFARTRTLLHAIRREQTPPMLRARKLPQTPLDLKNEV
jgi:hypothetical protein